MNLLREKLRAQGHHRLFCQDSPDMSGVNEAAKLSSEVGKEALEFYKQIYAEGAGDRAAATQVSLDTSRQQLEAGRKQIELADWSTDRMKTVQAPLEDEIIADARGYDTAERRASARTGAMADVEGQMEIQRQIAERRLQRSGVAPGSARDIALSNTLTLGGTKARAGAANMAEQRVEAIGSAKMNDAAGLLRGLSSSQATQLSGGLTAGNSGVNNAMQPIAISQQGASVMGQGFGAALDGYRNAGSLYAQANQGGDDGSAAGLGSAVGGIAIAI